MWDSITAQGGGVTWDSITVPREIYVGQYNGTTESYMGQYNGTMGELCGTI